MNGTRPQPTPIENLSEAAALLGKLGGNACKRKHGPEFYRMIGKRGGDANFKRQGKEGMSRAGKQGGGGKHVMRANSRKNRAGPAPTSLATDKRLDRLLENFRERKGDVC